MTSEYLNKILNYEGFEFAVKQKSNGAFYVILPNFKGGIEYAGTRSPDMYVSIMRFIRLIDNVMITPKQIAPVVGDMYHIEGDKHFYVLATTENTVTISSDCVVTKMVKIDDDDLSVRIITTVKPGTEIHKFEHNGFVVIGDYLDKVKVPASKDFIHRFLIFKAIEPLELKDVEPVQETKKTQDFKVLSLQDSMDNTTNI